MNKRIMSLVVLSIFFLTMKTSNGAGWYNNSWTKRKAITITGSAAGAQTNFQVQVTVSYDNDMQPDFDDIRFTDSDGTTLIDHWLETKTDSSSATFWVEVPNIPASPSTVTMYLYYGNASVSSASNGDNTFLFFDDFSGSSIDTTKWAVSASGGDGTTSFSNGEFRQYAAAGGYFIRTTPVPLTNNIVVEQKVKIGTYADATNKTRNRFPFSFTTLDYSMSDDPSPSTITYYWNGAYSSTTVTLNTWLRNTNKVYSSTFEWAVYIYSTGSLEYSNSASVTVSGSVFHSIGVGDTTTSNKGGDMTTDWIFVRKYASSEPSVGTAGAEETSAGNFFLLLE